MKDFVRGFFAVLCASLLLATPSPCSAQTEKLVAAGSGVNLEITRLIAEAFTKEHPEVAIKVTVNVARSPEEAIMQSEKGAALIKAAAAKTPAELIAEDAWTWDNAFATAATVGQSGKTGLIKIHAKDCSVCQQWPDHFFHICITKFDTGNDRADRLKQWVRA